MYKLRDYQEESIQALYDYFAKNTGNPILGLPTGAGKSLIIAEIIRRICNHYPDQRVMMLTHVKELIVQNYEKLVAIWPQSPAGVYSASLKKKQRYSAITYAGIASVKAKAHLFRHIDLIFIDECHLVNDNSASMYQSFINDLKEVNPKLKVIGFTATPYRLGLGKLVDGTMFDDMAYDLTDQKGISRLLNAGYLAPLVTKRTQVEVDLTDVKVNRGEFNSKQLEDALNRDELTERALREAIEIGHNRNSWMVFCSGIDHVVNTSNILTELGVSNVIVHSGNKEHKMSHKERDANIIKFKNGEVQAIVNSGVLTTGFDHPPVDLIVSLTATLSPGKWVQILGRGARPAEGKENCLVLDYCKNTYRLGPFDNIQMPKKRGKKGGDAPVKACEMIIGGKLCNTLVHASVRECPECGGEFPIKPKVQEVAGTETVMESFQEAPIVEEFKINHIEYAIHQKAGKPDSLKVTYVCNDFLSRYYEYTFPEYIGHMRKKFERWWSERFTKTENMLMPETSKEALDLINQGFIETPDAIRVWVNKKFPEVLAHSFTGDCFGKENEKSFPSTDKPNIEPVSVQSNNDFSDFDDDIPF